MTPAGDWSQETFTRLGLSEDRVWQALCAPRLRDLPENVRDIWRYGLTEMINNAIDHSGAELITVGLRRSERLTQACVIDDGVGIFLKIQHALALYDPREAILELAKGKLTTDPKGHTGEGIFFTSRMFDAFDIRSGTLHFIHHPVSMDDLLMEWREAEPGTLVFMGLADNSTRTLRAVFDEFTSAEDFTFSKTVVPVRLAQYEGEKLVARSQAKRLIVRFERFRTVVLDFDGVEEIGQGFADEVFRVFAGEHPNIELIPIRMTRAVEAMVKRSTPPAN